MSSTALTARLSRLTVAGAACLAVLAGGCAPDLGPGPKLTPPQDYAASRSFSAPVAAWPTDDWWTAYGDPQLNSLIETALKDGPDLREAEARVRAAEGQVLESRSRLLPGASVSGSIKETQISQSIGLPPQIAGDIPHGWNAFPDLGASLNWQLDFFGRNRAALAAATSQRDAARADAASARLQLATAVASNYASLLQLYADRDEAVQALKVRQQTLDLVGQRLRNGLETRGEFSQQNATVPVAQSDIDRLDLQILQTRHAMAALLGKGPDTGLDIARPGPATLRPLGLPSNLPADLIGRRPDIAAARLRAEAARHQERSAKADFYPSINLAASYTQLSLSPQNLFTHNLLLEQVGPAVSLPIFDGGQRRGAYRAARAEYEVAVAEYDKALANALKEVADAIATERSLTKQIADAQSSLKSSDDAYNVAVSRYRGGLSPFLDVLTAENALLQARRTLADLNAQALSLDVTLVRALGGGFQAAAIETASR
jgi:NodT family efflux transporter outer membrane factor (OMF) lipoprotein